MITYYDALPRRAAKQSWVASSRLHLDLLDDGRGGGGRRERDAERVARSLLAGAGADAGLLVVRAGVRDDLGDLAAANGLLAVGVDRGRAMLGGGV